MPTENRWYIPQRLLHRRFYGRLSLDDIQNNITEAHQLIENGTPFVHTLVDLQELGEYPRLNELTRGLKANRSDKEGWHIIIGATGITRFAGSVVVQLIDKRYRMVDTIEEALDFLQEQDETLDLTQVER